MDDRTHSASTQAGPSVAPKLEIIQGENAGESFKLKLKTTIGRERDNDVTLLDLKASRYHATITLEGGQWLLQDLGSVNGTILNDVALTTPTPLQSGDQITIGETILAFRTPTPSSAEPLAAASPATPSTAGRSVAAPLPQSQAQGSTSKPPRLAWIAGGVILLACFIAVFAIFLVATRISNNSSEAQSPTDDIAPLQGQDNNDTSPEPDNGEPSETTQTATIPAELSLVYEDDFSDSFGGWDDAFDTYTRKVYGNNRYQIEVTTSNLVAWGLANRDVADFEIEVEARQEDGDSAASYGLLFRFQDRENFYRFDVSGDGFFLLSKFIKGQWVTLVDWTESEFINPGSNGNLLKVTAFGPSISIWANGQQLAAVTDDSLDHGNFGLFVGTFAEPYTWVSYDNLKLWTPPDQEITLIPTATRPSASSQALPPTATATSPPPTATPEAQEEPAEATPTEETVEPTPTPALPTATPEPLPEYVSRDQTLARGEEEITGRIVFPIYDPERGTFDIYIADIADGNNLQLIQPNASQPGLSLDGTEFAYRSWQPDRRGLFARPLNGDDIDAWGFDSFFESARPQYSPIDNSLMYFSRSGGETPATYRVIDAVGQVMRREGFPIQGKSPKWAPNGQQFVYSSCLGSDCGIILSNIDGSAPVQLTNHPSDTNPEVSPDGETLVFMSERGGNWEIYRAGMDGSNITALTSDPASDGLPTWSPDSSEIAFLSNRDGEWALWTMDPDGTNKRRQFVLPGPVDGIVQHDIANSFGWLEENIDWIP